MSEQQLRAVRIGIALNSPGNTVIEEQYTTSPKVFSEITGSLTRHGAEIVRIEGDGLFFQRLSSLEEEVDLIFNLAEDIYQIAVPLAVSEYHLERKQQYPACTGTKAEGHILALNKSLARRVLDGKLPQPQWWRLNPGEYPPAGAVEFPVLVKPSNEGYSIGVADTNVVSSTADLTRSLDQLRERLKGVMLVESYLDGIEYSMGLVGNVITPAVAWDLSGLPGKPLVRGEDLKKLDLTIPHAKLVDDPSLAAAIGTQVATAHLELGLQDYSRSDFRAKGSEPVPCYIETNSMPGLVKGDSVLPWSAARAGVPYEDLIGSIVSQALKRLPEERLQELDTRGFDEAYGRMCSLASHTISVQGREFHLLMPRN
ncbi:MAG: hypothetical protein H6565_04990 [Lewinellaceae bacterium]|nr:hypothetical protein [Lewinellaceae bacterium]